MTNSDLDNIAPLALLAAASGARSMTGIAAVARTRAVLESESGDPGIGPRIATRFDQKIANGATALAAFEMMADKAPHIPDRTDAGPLFGRVMAGAVVGAAVAQSTGGNRRDSAIAGAVIAFASAHASYHLRRALAERMPPFVAALVEDAIVVGVASAGASLLAGGRNARLATRSR